MSVMSAPARERDRSRHAYEARAATVRAPIYVDPLDDDAPSDDVVVTTRRAISRVALVATEAGSRFQREGIAHDPMTWMMAPRLLFGGASAIEACLDRDACMRGILLHGLAIGLDAEPESIDALIGQGEEDDGFDWTHDPGVPRSPNLIAPEVQPPRGAARLFTATVVANDGFETVQAFHASIATNEAEIAGRLYMRMPASHPLYQFEDDAIPADLGIEVHGGVTYARMCQDGPSPERRPRYEARRICHVLVGHHPIREATGYRVENGHVWWFGFACDHVADVVPGDPGHDRRAAALGVAQVYRDDAYVVGEVRNLAAQLRAIADGEPAPSRFGPPLPPASLDPRRRS